jgi:hypothetical protein
MKCFSANHLHQSSLLSEFSVVVLVFPIAVNQRDPLQLSRVLLLEW